MKEYSVWVRVNRVQAKNLKEAIKKVKDTKSGKWPFEVLEALTRDFYPKEKK